MPNTGWAGFFPKVVLGATGILFALLVGYFVWLGTTLIEVREKTIGIESRLVTIENGIKTLDENRKRALEARSERNAQRILELEEEARQ